VYSRDKTRQPPIDPTCRTIRIPDLCRVRRARVAAMIGDVDPFGVVLAHREA
jgi:hypothetical protein